MIEKSPKHLEFETYLKNKYPDLFREMFINEDKNFRRDLRCEPGWFGIIDLVSARLEEYNKKNTEQSIIVKQIKEKYGELRYYVYPSNETVEDIIERGCVECDETCEICAAKAARLYKLKNRRLKTLCVECKPSDANECEKRRI